MLVNIDADRTLSHSPFKVHKKTKFLPTFVFEYQSFLGDNRNIIYMWTCYSNLHLTPYYHFVFNVINPLPSCIFVLHKIDTIWAATQEKSVETMFTQRSSDQKNTMLVFIPILTCSWKLYQDPIAASLITFHKLFT